MPYTSDSAVWSREIGTEAAHVDVTELLLGDNVNACDLFQENWLLGSLMDVIPIYKFLPLTRVYVIITEILFLLFLRFSYHFEPVPLDLAVARGLIFSDP